MWRAGTAHILDEDDPRERQRRIGEGNLMRRLCVSASAAMATDPLTVRVDLDTHLPSASAQPGGGCEEHKSSVHRNLNMLGCHGFTASVPREGLRPLRAPGAVELDDDDDGGEDV